MKIDIITLFPQGLEGFLKQSILGKAQEKKQVLINLHNLRDFAKDKRKTVDGRPYGGGVGMILRADITVEALEKITAKRKSTPYKILLDPKGKLFNQKRAQEFAKKDWLILVCGHYEGVDERVRNFVDEEISIGDYILGGGEAAALVLVDAITRLLPGVLAKIGAKEIESFQESLLEYPQYTRPTNYRGLKVPEILFTGNQTEIIKWRKREALKLTKRQRPDFFERIKKTQKD
jgi:tRNA (guanine37-N1)-methyltransferase